MNKIYFYFLLLILSSSAVDAQNAIKSSFKKLIHLSNSSLLPINYYPNSSGDFWEYILQDTMTLGGLFYTLNFTYVREVLADTTMQNGVTYKKIEWKYLSNSTNYPVVYEYERVDTSGNVYIFYNGIEYLLFDFSKLIGETYPAHLPDHYWFIADRYTTEAFGDTVLGMDFSLCHGNTVKKKYSIFENFGIMSCWEPEEVQRFYFWGVEIGTQKFGYLQAYDQVDWNQFYPTSIGDYWVYNGFNGTIPDIITVRVVGDSIMPDGYLYKEFKIINYTQVDTSIGFRRIDSSGTVYIWDPATQSNRRAIRFTSVIGDTTRGPTSFILRMDDKNSYNSRYGIGFKHYPDIVYDYQYYVQGLGLKSEVLELSSSELVGAFINGQLWGDTILTDVSDYKNVQDSENILYQNFPNPFNSQTTIAFNIKRAAEVQISLYNIIGEEEHTIVSDTFMPGYHEVKIDMNDLPSGVYFVKMFDKEKQSAIKIIYLK